MTDSTPTEATKSAPVPTEPLSAATAGQLIRAARQQQGLHLAVLSLKLKVPVRQLEALEADQHDPIKGPVFVRALAASVCRQLNMDAAPVLALLPQAPGQLPVPRHHMASVQSDRREDWRPTVASRGWPWPTLLVAVLMLGLIAALLWMPSPSTWSWLQTTPVVAEAPLAMPEPPIPSEPPEPNVPVEVAPLPAPPVTSAPLNAGPVTPVPSAPTNQSAPATGVLAFAASQDSWIEIRDGQNRVLWSRMVRGGESTQVQYPLPMHVVVGRAAVVQVSYQGKPFDLAPHTKVTVARFEVKE